MFGYSAMMLAPMKSAHVRTSPCEVCGGYASLPKGRGVRCWGFTKGEWVYCTRENFAGRLEQKHDGTFHHWMKGTCKCGMAHGGGPISTTWASNVDNDLLKSSRLSHARWLWKSAEPAEGTPVEIYLRGRGITIPIPPTIRYLPNHLHMESGKKLPVMLAAISTEARELVGVHRTYLTHDGKKADVHPNKMRLGSGRGGAVRLGPAGETLGLTEGIEDGLTVMQVENLPVWAVVGISNLASVQLPPLPLARLVIIGVDNDVEGMAGGRRGAQAIKTQGREVLLYGPPDTAKDFNEALMSK